VARPGGPLALRATALRFKRGLVRKMLILKDGVVSVDDDQGGDTLNIPEGDGWK
jgi:hypothetical protein